uniref:Uncharacterized protein n=1 Tax=Globodera rostochiensis TaxID=31243 RepID=A0A914HVJ0_GLORO
MAFFSLHQTSCCSFATSLFIVAVLSGCCHCDELEELALEGYACAKVGAEGLPNGFSLTKDDQLKIDMSESPNGKSLSCLLLNAKDETVIISVAAVNQPECKKFYKSISLTTNGGPCHRAAEDNNDDQQASFSCMFPGGRVKDLPDAHHINISSVKTDSKFECTWEATIDGVRVLQNISSADADKLEKCWDGLHWSWLLVIVVGSLFGVVVIIGVAVLVYCRQQRRTQRTFQKPYTLAHLERKRSSNIKSTDHGLESEVASKIIFRPCGPKTVEPQSKPPSVA